MKIGIIIPTRGDRPELLANAMRMLKNQTLQPHIVEVIDMPPLSNEKDITYRYRTGYDRLRRKNLDVIGFWEDDDWYSADYLKLITGEWDRRNRPDIFGTNYTIYYHLRLRAWLTFQHITRSSAMSTLIMPDMNFSWCHDEQPYTDIALWNTLQGTTWDPGKHICLGIKHSSGKCGGDFHNTRLERYHPENAGVLDPNYEFLKNTIDAESFQFYLNYVKNDNTLTPLQGQG